jgi:hypothetical protein
LLHLQRERISPLRRLSENQPLLVAVDDMQWLDAPSAGALQFALRRLTEERVGLLTTSIVGAATTMISFDGAERITVGPLRHRATRAPADVAVSAPEGVERGRVARHRQDLLQLVALEAEDERLRDVELAPVAAADRAVERDDELVAAPDVDDVRPVGAAGELGRASEELEDLGPAAVLARHGAPTGYAPDDAVADKTPDGDRVALGERPERVADAGDVVHARRFPRMRWTVYGEEIEDGQARIERVGDARDEDTTPSSRGSVGCAPSRARSASSLGGP